MKNCLIFLYLVSMPFIFSCNTDDDEPEIIEEENLSTQIFFSEYLEGSSFNKALEIVNLTGETIDLEASGYSIKKQSNGSGDWMGETFLTGSISNNNVFVIAHESADIPEITANTNQVKTGAPMDFNGNDPVGLFKEGELIDVIGHLDDSGDFAKDATLRRKETVNEPSTTFNPDAWEVYEIDTAENIGEY